MDDSTFSNIVINALIRMRKIKLIRIKQKTGIFEPRPNIHMAKFSPFGTAKSSEAKKINIKNSSSFMSGIIRSKGGIKKWQNFCGHIIGLSLLLPRHR